MKIVDNLAGNISPALLEEAKQVCARIQGGVPFTKEEQEEAAAEIDRMREENARRLGIQNIVVDLIREMREQPMKYVIDASVEVKTFVQEADSGKAIRLRDDCRHGLHQLLAPDLFPTEVCNALLILERSGKLQPGEAQRFFIKFLREATPLHEASPLLPRALDMAQQFRQSVYDCLYAALAEQERCEHVTADDKFLKAVQPSLPFVISLAQLP